MAKVLLINPVVREEDAPRHIPYGIALLAAIAVKRGHQVQIYDANAWRKGFDIVEQVCAADDWDVIGVGGLTTTYAFFKKTCEIAKRISPNSILLAGGGLFTSMPHDIMKWIPQIDAGCVGEAFVSFPRLLEALDKGDRNFSKINGLAYRGGRGECVLTPVAPTIPDLDELPYPAWDLLPLDIYFKNSQELYSEELYTSKRRIDVNGSLGCNLVCRYCWHLGTTGDMIIDKNEDGVDDVKFSYGRTIRYHSPRYIVDMVKTLHERYQIDFVSLIDENLMTMDAFSRRTWIKDVSREWIAAGLQPTCRRDRVEHDESCRGVHFGGTSHATLAKEDALSAMYEAGCSFLIYGIESFDPVILKNLGKATTKESNYRAVDVCKKSGIRPIPNFIIGFPEESFESIRHNIEGLLRLGIHVKPHFATPYPGSEWYYTYKQSILEQYDGDLERFILDLGDASKISAVISHKFSAMELLGLQTIVHQRNLRLLDQAEKHWGNADSVTRPLAVPRASTQFERKKLEAPIEDAAAAKAAMLGA